MYAIVSLCPNNLQDVKVHGFASQVEVAKRNLATLAREAMREATAQHIALTVLGTQHLPIIPFTEYNRVHSNDLQRIFLDKHALMFADEHDTTIELLRYVENTTWYYYKYVTQQSAQVVRIFSIRILSITASTIATSTTTNTGCTHVSVDNGVHIAGVDMHSLLCSSTPPPPSCNGMDAATTPTIPVAPPMPPVSTSPPRYIPALLLSNVDTEQQHSHNVHLQVGVNEKPNMPKRMLFSAELDAEFRERIQARRHALEQSITELQHDVATLPLNGTEDSSPHAAHI